MKQFLLLFCVTFMSLHLRAQLHLDGHVANAENQPVVGATVVLKNLQNKKTIQLVTNQSGIFTTQEIPENSIWRVSVYSLGAESTEKQVHFTTKDVLLEIALKEKSAILEPLEVRATRAGDHAPFAKTDLSAQDIAKGNLGRDLPYVLEQTPNVVINSDAGNGIGYTGIHIRGSDGTRTNVTLNGIPYNDAESAGSYFVDLPDVVSSVGSIQIQRGVGTSSNGAGAFGATINLSTNEVNKEAYTELNNSYGSFNSWKNTIRAGTGLMDGKYTADVRFSNISSDGYIDRAKSNLQSLLFSTAYLGKKTSIRFNFITGKEKTYQAWDGVPADMIAAHPTYNDLGMINDSTFYKNQTDNYTQTHYQLFINHQLNDHLSFALASFLTKGKGYYEEYRVGDDYADYGLPFPTPSPGIQVTNTDLIRQKYLDNSFYGQTFSMQYQTLKDTWTLGGSWTNYDGNHYGTVIWAENGGVPNDYRYYNEPAFKYDKNVYLKWMHQFGQYFHFYADIQYRNVWHKMDGFEDNPTLFIKRNFNFVNPKFGISYEKNGYKIYGSYAMANKEPDRDDFESSLSSQPKREQLNDFEAGIEKKAKRYSWAANIYYMAYNDQLVLTGRLNDVGSATRINVPKSYRAGVELQGSYTFTNWLNAAANISFSKNKIKQFTAYYDNYDIDGNFIDQKPTAYSNTDIAFSPNSVGAATINFSPCRKLTISLISKYVGDQFLDNTSDKDRRLAGYYDQDARITVTIKNKWMKEINLIGQVYNVFNHIYYTNGATYPEYDNGKLNNYLYYFPMAGTNFMFGLNIKL